MFETEYKISKVIKKNKSYIECSFFVVKERSVVNKKKKSDEINIIVEKSEK